MAARGEVPGGLQGAVGHAVDIGREGLGDDDDTHIRVVVAAGRGPCQRGSFRRGERPVSVALRPVPRARKTDTKAPPGPRDSGPTPALSPVARPPARERREPCGQRAAVSGPILLRTAVCTSASSAGSAASRRSRSTTRASPVSACRAATSRVVSSQSQRHSTANPVGEGRVGGGERPGRPAAQLGGRGLPVDVAQDGGRADDAEASRTVDEGPQGRGVRPLAPHRLAQRAEHQVAVLCAAPAGEDAGRAAAPRASGRWTQPRARSRRRRAAHPLEGGHGGVRDGALRAEAGPPRSDRVRRVAAVGQIAQGGAAGAVGPGARGLDDLGRGPRVRRRR